MTRGEYVARTILEQIGGQRFVVMTGARNFQFIASDSNVDGGIAFNIGRNIHRINMIRITLNYMDTYDMEFLYVTKPSESNAYKGKINVVSKAENVYCDMLEEVFTGHTGLYTRL